MGHLSQNAKRGAVNAPSAESISDSLERAEFTSAPITKQAAPAPHYRSARKGPNGESLWVRGEQLSPVLTAGEMRGRARHATAVAFQDAGAGRSLRWSEPSLYLDGRTVIGGETIRTPTEHRAILAALDEVQKPNEQTVAELARAIADAWEGSNNA